MADPCELSNEHTGSIQRQNLAIRVTVKISKDSVPMIANKSHGGTSLTTGRLLVSVYVIMAFSVTKHHIQLHCICSGLSHFESNKKYIVIHSMT